MDSRWFVFDCKCCCWNGGEHARDLWFYLEHDSYAKKRVLELVIVSSNNLVMSLRHLFSICFENLRKYWKSHLVANSQWWVGWNATCSSDADFLTPFLQNGRLFSFFYPRPCWIGWFLGKIRSWWGSDGWNEWRWSMMPYSGQGPDMVNFLNMCCLCLPAGRAYLSVCPVITTRTSIYV